MGPPGGRAVGGRPLRAAFALILGIAFVLPLTAVLAEDAKTPSATAPRHHPALGLGPGDVLVVLLDTGIDPAHPEFAPDQLVAWWDFGRNGPPADGSTDPTWDAATPAPYDPTGHGTGTASLVGGRNVGAFPGVKLAMAKVLAANGSIVHLEAALTWAHGTLGADVVSVSLSSAIPAFPAATRTPSNAREAIALEVVAAGNGLLTTGARYPSETSFPGSDPDALVVGATNRDGSAPAGYSASNLDPDVVAWGMDTCMARAAGTWMAAPNPRCMGGDTRYGVASGTSFSTPRVAGVSAAVLLAARNAGQDAGPERVKALVLGTALDNLVVPYAIEGFGLVDPASAAKAKELAASGGAPPAPSPANAAAHAVAQALRGAWSLLP